MELSAAAKVLTVSRDGTSDGDSLRMADTLLLKRLGLAILLRNADALVDSLPGSEWKKERSEFYDFVIRHAFAPGKFFELLDYIPRLVGVAIACHEWSVARKIVQSAIRIMAKIQANAVVQLEEGIERPPTDEESHMIWGLCIDHLRRAFCQAILKSKSPAKNKGRSLQLLKLYTETAGPTYDSLELNDDSLDVMVEKMFCLDLARIPYKSFLLNEMKDKKSFKYIPTEPDYLPTLFRERKEEIVGVLNECRKADTSVMPLLFPTRPLSPADLSILIPNSALDPNRLKQRVNAVRGTLYPVSKGANTSKSNGKTLEIARIGYGKNNLKPLIAVTSLETDIGCWCGAAGGEPTLSADRFIRVASLCNSILKSPRDARPDYVLFPELSIPDDGCVQLLRHF